MPDAQRYDAVVIGAGQAGPALAARLAGAGRRVALIERRRLGGTCVNTGCIPTKTLVASAYAAHLARRAAEFGVVLQGPVGTDMKAVKARKDGVVGNSRQGLERWLRGTRGVTLLEGHARFEAPHVLTIGSERLQAEQIFINVGGRASTPPLPGLAEVRYLTNSTMMDVDFLPEHLVIVGGSYIGLEFAQMYRRFGSKVTIVEMAERLIGREDPDVSDSIRELLEREGVAVRTQAKCIRVA